MNKLKLEVHEHCYVSGPRANGPSYKFKHSHAGGSIPHSHPQTGPACYTIDKDEWAAKTGLKGGGRKKFTVQLQGEQLQWIALTEEQRTFEVHIGAPMHPEHKGKGPGIALPLRMILGHGMKMKVCLD